MIGVGAPQSVLLFPACFPSVPGLDTKPKINVNSTIVPVDEGPRR